MRGHTCTSTGERLKSAPSGETPGATAREYDPTIEQTRTIARQMFASDLAAARGLRRDPLAARHAWIESSSRRGDAGMVSILERIDAETFEAEWRELVVKLERRGLRETLDWLEQPH